MRRKHLFVGQVVLLLFVIVTLYFEGHHLSRLPLPASLHFSTGSSSGANSSTSTGKAVGDKGILPTENITHYINAILDPSSTELPRLQCPTIPNPSVRYNGLKVKQADDSAESREILYFFAIDLRDTLTLLPRLLGSVVETIRFLGPSRCALSVVEGNSQDGTFEVLEALRAHLDQLTIYYLKSSDVDPKRGNRIAKLAALRNMAVQPVFGGGVSSRDDKQTSARYTDNTTIIFVNDVAACTEDILELVLQRRVLGADMVCGLDWVYVGQDPTFYDVWVARGMTGDSFFEIPPDGNWNSAWNLFWNDDAARESVATHRPFQVFSCWNGAAVFSAAPLLGGSSGDDKNKKKKQDGIRFRSSRPGECNQGEPQLFCKDMWYRGYGKIAVIPSVNLEYSDERARQIKELKGFTSQWAPPDVEATGAVNWQANPPPMVKCIPSYEKQTFRPWNETLG